jgi:3',5'-cyclic AMP phosphodiesterase CpdA
MEEKTPELRFNQQGTFRIAQFTDIHWNPTSENNPKNLETIRMVLESEKPDLVILTGDIVTAGPAAKGWTELGGALSESGIPWAVTLGNHDDEADMNREQIFALLTGLLGFVGSEGPDISGTGNYVLQVLHHASEQPAALIWCFDSHGYPSLKEHGDYDWIKHDQIEWYRNLSAAYTAKNNQQILPALAYFHIPLPEYSLVAIQEDKTGRFEEKVCSPEINSGLFAAFLERGDVMGMFVGHDHVNNYIGTHLGIALGYGQHSGIDSYGEFPKGARIVELQEGVRSFTTWIRTAEGKMDLYNFNAQ